MEQATKRIKVEPNVSGPLIGTHNGTFHADEALAVYLLRLLPSYRPSRLVRTRDPTQLSGCHTVVDVGGEYDAHSNRFDHHQRTFGTTFPDRPTKLSSAGLIYMHFGKSIIARQTQLQEESTEVDILWRKLYADFIEALDAHDNGISAYDPSETQHISKRFDDSGVSLGAIIGDMNQVERLEDENEDAKEFIEPQAEDGQSAEDGRFLKASSFIGGVFLRKLSYYALKWYPARTLVRDTFIARKQHDEQGRIMVFEKGCPWKDHLYNLESEQQTPEDEKAIYVLYPEDENNQASKWRVQAVGKSKSGFESRRALPEVWRGLRDEELSAKSQIPGCIFVHASGFIGGNTSRDGALKMAQQALVI